VTVLSRCLQFSLKRLSSNLIGERLKAIASTEQLEYEPAGLALVARSAEGSMRDGLSLLDQLVAFGGGALSEANARAMLGTIDRGHVTKIVEALARGDGPELLAQVKELDRDAPDYDRALVDLGAFLQRLAIVQVVPEAAREDEEFDADTLERLSRAIAAEDVQLYYQIALAGRRDLPMAPDPRIGFEMTLLRMLAFRPDSAGAGRTGSPGGAASRDGRSIAAQPALASAPPAIISDAAIDAARWPAVVSAAGLSGMARQIALNCVPASFADGALVLRLDESSAFSRSPAVEEKLTQGLSKYLGRDIRVTFEVSQSDLATPARQRAIADQDRALRAAAAFDEDPAVKGLQERFGAEVDVASVKPTNL
jgi:DNA polymerase III subunit gamma/tau